MINIAQPKLIIVRMVCGIFIIRLSNDSVCQHLYLLYYWNNNSHKFFKINKAINYHRPETNILFKTHIIIQLIGKANNL